MINIKSDYVMIVIEVNILVRIDMNVFILCVVFLGNQQTIELDSFVSLSFIVLDWISEWLEKEENKAIHVLTNFITMK
jgi:hypothetical protein